MNQMNIQLFKLIVNAAETFKRRVNDALLVYRTEMNEARQYAARFKDETAVLNNQKSLLIASTQEKIRKAQRVLASELERYTDQLTDQLHSHVSEPLDAGFRDQLLTIAQFGMKPSKTQIEALLKTNGGNAIGIEALSKVLSDVESPYRITFRDITEYENDISKIRSLMFDPITYDMNGTDQYSEGENLHHEAVEVMSSLERLFFREDGTQYTKGFRWDNISLLIARNAFESTIEDIEKMQQSWIADVSFQAAEVQNEAEEQKTDILDSDGAETDQAKQAEDYESSTTITDSDSDAITLARKLGKESARKTAPMPEDVKEAYMR